MSTEEVKEAEQPQPATEEVVAAKPVKEKKSKTPREKKPKSVSHPPYFQMIKEALMAMNEKSGSSPYAIAKYMEEKHKSVLPSNFRKMLGLQLKNSAARGKLIKIRASYKLTEEIKQTTKRAKSATNKAEEKKDKKKPRTVSRRKTRSVNKKMESKKGKKSSGGNKPKQPKSIKSPAAKRTRKPASVIASAS